MSALAEKLSEIVGAAFAAQGLDAALGAVRVSDRPDLCQFQCNGAMAAAKQAGKNPREVAEAVVAALQNCHPDRAQRVEGSQEPQGYPSASGAGVPFAQDDIFKTIEIAGPGFINLDVTDEFLATHLAEGAGDKRLGIDQGPDQTVILDYGGPNIAKPMHVGHLRSSIIGDSLRRIYAFAGYKTIGDVHLGDWGLQMGQILSELEERGVLGQPQSMDDLEEIYPAASAACKGDEARMEKARAATVKLQDGDETYRAAWQQFIDVSIEGMKGNFERLGVHFDEWKGEASAHEFIAPMVDQMKANSHAEESDGALVIKVEEEGDKKEMPPLILYKRDGAVMYGTTDLATIVDRVKTHDPAKMIYIVDQRQSLHFEQVFRAARKSGLVRDEVELTHAGFGTMNGPDGKPFKTREGGVMKLEDLIAMGIEKAQARLDEAELAKDAGEKEREDIAHKVAIAAIKFADLQNQRQSDYVFDLDRLTSFEGKTGPYLLYQAVRIKSLLRKAEADGLKPGQGFIIEDPDRSLALLLTELPDHFDNVLKNYTPHVLCEYAYRLGQEFSSFYSNCHILSEENEVLRDSRLALCDLTYRQLELVLGLLGIQIPERM